MRSRLDRLPARQLVHRLKDLQTYHTQIKALQYLGSDSARPTRVFTNAAYDIEVTNVVTGNTVQLVFSPAETNFANMSLVYDFVYIPTWSATAVGEVLHERLLPANNQQAWNLYLEPFDSGSTVQLKFYLFVIGGGSFTVSQIA